MFLLASLGLALAAAEGVPTAIHAVSVPHRSGPISAEYQGEIAVHYKQLGSPGPGGRASTLRCVWKADLEINRIATSATGALASRSFTHGGVASGARPGWCSTKRAAIAADVAARIGDASLHLATAAREDRKVLTAEMERLAARPAAS